MLPVLLLVLYSPIFVGQQRVPRTLRYMSEWTVAPQQVELFSKELSDRVRPVFQRLLEDGTVTDWGIQTSLIAEDNGVTNGMWFEITSLAGVDKTLKELAKLSPGKTAQFVMKHHDYLLRTNLRRSKPGNGADGFYYFNSTLIQPGKVDQWREWWDKYQKPMYEQFLADGLVTSYEVDSGEMHTMDPNMVYLIYVSPSADALDKINDAFLSRAKKRSAEESQAISAAYDAVVVPGSHRDYFARANIYETK